MKLAQNFIAMIKKKKQKENKNTKKLVFEDDDIVTVYVDLNKGLLKYYKNGIDLDISYNDIQKDQVYRLAVSSMNVGFKINMISHRTFSEENADDIHATKPFLKFNNVKKLLQNIYTTKQTHNFSTNNTHSSSTTIKEIKHWNSQHNEFVEMEYNDEQKHDISLSLPNVEYKSDDDKEDEKYDHENKNENTSTFQRSDGLFDSLPHYQMLKASSPIHSGNVSHIFGLNHKYIETVLSKQREMPFFSVCLQKIYLIPTYYALRGSVDGGKTWNRGWVLLGSINGKSWDVIDRKNDTDVLKEGKVCYFKLNNIKFNYNEFCLKITQENSDDKMCFQFSGFELFGILSRTSNREQEEQHIKLETINNWQVKYELRHDLNQGGNELDIITITYDEDRKEEGLFYYLIRKRKSFQIKSSPLASWSDSLENVVGCSINDKQEINVVSNAIPPFLTVHLGALYLIPTHYCINNAIGGKCRNYIKGWRLLGSINDGETWDILDEQYDYIEFREAYDKGQVKTSAFKLMNVKYNYNQFCLEVTDSEQDNMLILSGFEMYGILSDKKDNQTVDIYTHNKMFLMQKSIKYAKHNYDALIQSIQIIKTLFAVNDADKMTKESYNESISYICDKFASNVKNTKSQNKKTIESLYGICRHNELADSKKCISYYKNKSYGGINKDDKPHPNEVCYIDMTESRRNVSEKYVPEDPHVDDIFYILAYHETDESLMYIIEERLKRWNEEPNDFKNSKILFTFLKELKMITKIIICRSSNPIETAMVIADYFSKDELLEKFERIKDNINELVEVAQNEAIKYLDKFSSNRSKHLLLQIGDSMEFALDNKLLTFISSDDVILFRHWSWIGNPRDIIKQPTIDSLTKIEDELNISFDCFIGSFFSIFRSNDNFQCAKEYFTTLEQQKRYFYSPI
eukprot:56205_1